MIVNGTSFAEVGGIFINKSIYRICIELLFFQITKLVGYSWAPKLCRHRRQAKSAIYALLIDQFRLISPLCGC